MNDKFHWFGASFDVSDFTGAPEHSEENVNEARDIHLFIRLVRYKLHLDLPIALFESGALGFLVMVDYLRQVHTYEVDVRIA